VHNIHTSISWLRRHDGEWPEQIRQMWQDIETGALDIEVRQSSDIEALLNRQSYLLAGRLLTLWSDLFRLPGLRFLARVYFWFGRRVGRLVAAIRRNYGWISIPK
jgi:hypothetical protein